MPAAPATAGGGLGPSLSQITTILRARWKASVVILVVSLAAGAVMTKTMPRTYRATATLMLNYDVNDPLTGKEFPIGLLGSYMATQTELMQSPEILRPVIDRLKLAENPRFAGGNRGGEATLNDWVEAQLRRKLEISMGRWGSQLMYVGVTHENNTEAADIANAVAEVYLAQHSRRTTNPAVDRASRYTENLEELKRKVDVAQQAIADLRRKSGAVDLNARVDLEFEALANLESRLLESQNMAREARAKAVASQSAGTQVQGSDVVRGLQTQLSTMQAQMAQLRTTLGPNHPQIRELQSQIDATKASLASAGRTFADAAGSELKARQGALGDLEAQVASQRRKVMETRAARDEASKLQVELESAQAAYKRALEGYDSVMVATSGKYTNVSLVSAARPPVKADKPNPMVNMLLALVAGLGLGVALPFIHELLNRRVRCRDDLERDLGIPVLTEFGAAPVGAVAT